MRQKKLQCLPAQHLLLLHLLRRRPLRQVRRPRRSKVRGASLSRKFVLLSDLRRGFLLRAGVYLLTALIFRELMTRHDARLSVMRAFSFSEMRDLAVRAGWENFQHGKFHFARQAIWLGGCPKHVLHDFAFEAVLEIS